MSEKIERRRVPADLIELEPGGGGIGYWIMASPLLLFLAWNWIAVFNTLSPIAVQWVDTLLASLLFLLFVLPLGVLAHRLVTALPRPFQHAGWSLEPLEPVSEAEQYLVRYSYQARRRAPNGFDQLWGRAAQGWFYIEIAAILIGGVALIPLFFSALGAGFGQ